MNELFATTGGRPPLDRQVLAVQNAALLRAVHAASAQPEGFRTLSAIAAEVDKDASNLSKTFKVLEREGLVSRANDGTFGLTEEGAAFLPRLDVLDGRAAMPEGVLHIPRHLLVPNPLNPRTRATPDEDEELADTIEAMGGKILQPLSVTPPFDDEGRRYILIGERRWRSTGLCEARGTWEPDKGLPCLEGPPLDPVMTRKIALIENGARAGLTELEEARAMVSIQDETGWTAAEIGRQVGKQERVVQERIRVIRAAKPEDIAAHEADRKAFTWERLRDSVKEGKPKPALDLSPKLALTLIEVAAAAVVNPAREVSEPGYTELFKAPTGGALSTLQDRGLLTWRWQGVRCFAKVLNHSTPAGEYLEQRGFLTDRDALLFEARAAVVGEMSAQQLAKDNEWATPELNRPADAGQTAADGRSLADRQLFALDGAEADTPPPATPQAPAPSPGASARDDFADQLRRAQAAPAPPPPGDPFDNLDAAGRLAIIELAHKVDDRPVQASGVSTARTFDHHRDPKAMPLVMAGLVRFLPTGPDGYVAALLPPAQQRIAELYPDGIGDEDLYEARAALDGQAAADLADGLYLTPWLNEPAPTEPQAEAPPPDNPAPEPRTPFALDEAIATFGLLMRRRFSQDPGGLSDDFAAPIDQVAEVAMDAIWNGHVIDGALSLMVMLYRFPEDAVGAAMRQLGADQE